jgi:hypothetical protein
MSTMCLISNIRKFTLLPNKDNLAMQCMSTMCLISNMGKFAFITSHDYLVLAWRDSGWWVGGACPPSHKPNQAHPLVCPMLFIYIYIYIYFKNTCTVKTHGLYKPKPSFLWLLIPFGHIHTLQIQVFVMHFWEPHKTNAVYIVYMVFVHACHCIMDFINTHT